MNEKEKIAADLAGLTAAEEYYLRVRGWQPFHIGKVGDQAPLRIMWKRSLTLKEQDDAVLEQKNEDRKLLSR